MNSGGWRHPSPGISRTLWPRSNCQTLSDLVLDAHPLVRFRRVFGVNTCTRPSPATHSRAEQKKLPTGIRADQELFSQVVAGVGFEPT